MEDGVDRGEECESASRAGVEWSRLVPRAEDYVCHKLIQIYNFIQFYFASEAEGVRLVMYNLNF